MHSIDPNQSCPLITSHVSPRTPLQYRPNAHHTVFFFSPPPLSLSPFFTHRSTKMSAPQNLNWIRDSLYMPHLPKSHDITFLGLYRRKPRGFSNGHYLQVNPQKFTHSKLARNNFVAFYFGVCFIFSLPKNRNRSFVLRFSFLILVVGCFFFLLPTPHTHPQPSQFTPTSWYFHITTLYSSFMTIINNNNNNRVYVYFYPYLSLSPDNTQ